MLWFEVIYYVYQFIGSENDSDSNTECSQRHSLYQTVIKKVPNNKPFVRSNLLRYKAHNTILIPKQFIRNNVQQGECLTYSSDVTKHSDYFVWKDTSERVARRCDDTVDKKRVYSRALKHLFWREFSNQKYRQNPPETLSPTRY